MKTSIITSNTYLDLLFALKYKEYGAYELRKNYEKRLRKALGFLLMGVVILSGSALAVANNSNNKILTIETDKIKESVLIREIHLMPSPQKIKPPKGIVKTEQKTTVPKVNVAQIYTHNIIVTTKKIDTPPSKQLDKNIDPPINPTNAATASVPSNNIPEGSPSGNNENVNYSKSASSTNINEIKAVADLDIEPAFPGGEDALIAFLEANLIYPEKAKLNGTAGKIDVNFVVDELGNISTVKLVNSLGDGCDQEALRVVKIMPKWKPGRYQGKAVKSFFNVPIVFEMER